jgi:hypothetical protein
LCRRDAAALNQQGVTRWNQPELSYWGIMTIPDIVEAWITIQKLLQTDPKLDEYHRQILPDVLSLLNHRQDKLKGVE